MNGSRAAVLTLPRRLINIHIGDLPVIPLSILGVLLVAALLANVLAPYNPEIGSLGDRFKPPAWQAGGSEAHLLGTDHLGRDVLSRLIFGARVSMMVGTIAVLVAGVIGT